MMIIMVDMLWKVQILMTIVMDMIMQTLIIVLDTTTIIITEDLMVIIMTIGLRGNGVITTMTITIVTGVLTIMIIIIIIIGVGVMTIIEGTTGIIAIITIIIIITAIIKDQGGKNMMASKIEDGRKPKIIRVEYIFVCIDGYLLGERKVAYFLFFTCVRE